MSTCSFCKKHYEINKGLTYVLTDGTVIHFCSSKCFKNHKLGRKSKKVRWIKKSRKTKAEQQKKAEQQAEKQQKEKQKKEQKQETKKVENKVGKK